MNEAALILLKIIPLQAFKYDFETDCRARVEGNGFDVGILGILGILRILRILRSPAAAPSKQAASGRFLDE